MQHILEVTQPYWADEVNVSDKHDSHVRKWRLWKAKVQQLKEFKEWYRG